MIRPTKDNVLLVLEPDVPKQTEAGVYTVQLQNPSKAYANRIGRVLAVGPGGRDENGKFHGVDVVVGERAVVHCTAGDRYAYTKRQDFAEMFAAELERYGIPGDSAEFRMVRSAEVLAVLEDEAEAAE